MSRFEVWAPRAERVDLILGDERRPMRPGRAAASPAAGFGGWWHVDVPEAGPGADYAFSVDDGEPRPDPRSRWQPEGVHGPSRVVGDERGRAGGGPGTEAGDARGDERGSGGGAWTGLDLPRSVLYELHVGTFTPEGTLDAAIGRLGHLTALGVDAVSLMPVNAFPGRHGWGYDGVDLYAVHEAYGGPAALHRFVDACHGRGLGVILDVVYNHLGPSGNYLAELGPYFTDRYQTPWGDAPNLDGWGSDEVRRFFLDNARMWLGEYGIDGLRLDAVHAIVDASAVHILEELAVETRALEAEVGRPLWLIAESDLNDPRIVRSPEAGGYGLNAQWSDDFHHALHAALTGETAGYYGDFGALGDIATALRHAYVYAGRYSHYRGRRHGRPADGLPGRRFLGYLQTHDQVGNRAVGERIGQLVGPELQKVAAALVLTSPFVPMLFQGEEWAASSPFQYFTDHPEPELGRAVREGRRAEFAAFGWDPEAVPDPQDPATFQRSKLRWDERETEPHASVEAWYRALIALRRRRPGLGTGPPGDVDARADEGARTLTVRRGDTLLACNVSDQPRTVSLDGAFGDAGAWVVALASRGEARATDGAVALPAASAALLVR